jgi:hypothetical protein
MRKTQYEQIFSALTPIADILGGRAVHGSEGGRFPFHSQHYAHEIRPTETRPSADLPFVHYIPQRNAGV